MKAFRLGFVSAAMLAGALAEPAAAQVRQAPSPDAPRLMVLVFRGNEPKVGVEVADQIRDRVGREIPVRNLWNIPKGDIEATLKASGYSTTEPLNTNDAKALGTLMRADEYIEGTVTRAPGKVSIDGRLVLVRDPSLVQPFATVSGENLGSAAGQLAKEIRIARAQLEDEKDCYRNSREGKFAEAIAAAKKGIAKYPKATIARTCQLRAMVENKATDDEVLALSQEILALDPRNKVALANAADIYKKKGDEEKAVEAWVTLLAADPSNTRLVEQVVRELGQAGKADAARPIIEKAVSENPGDPSLVGLAYTVGRAVRDWKMAERYGEELVTLDTAKADTLYYVQMAAVYASDSMPQKAAEVLSRGVAKYGQNASLRLAQARAYRAAGQNQQAVEAIRGAIGIDPKVPGARLLMAQLYMDMSQPDSALATIRSGLAAGDDASTLGQIALGFGNQVYRAANGQQDAAAKRAGFMQALPFLQLSDSASASPTAKFLLGVTAFNLGLGYAQDMQAATKAKQNAAACTAAKSASEYFATASINVPQGGDTNKQAMGQIMGAIQQYGPYLEQVQKATCK